MKPSKSHDRAPHSSSAPARRTASREKLTAIAIIFVVSLGIRLWCWSDVRLEVWKVQTAVTSNYKHLARLLRDNGAFSFFDQASPTSDPDLLGHPPGYPIVLALGYSVFGESDSAIQVLQMVGNSMAAVLIFLIAAELFPLRVALIAGTMGAFAPQFSWNSALLLPDTLAILPLLFAVWLIIRARERSVVLHLLGAGALIGVSCWLRANSLLLTPFLLLPIIFLFAKGQKTPAALALLAGAVFVIAPLTIRNALVFHRFIPVSLGAGQTLIEGIADYDTGRRFGLPQTDLELIQQEAESSGKPDYARSLFSPDGIDRDRARLARGFAIVRSHPFWFAGAMIRRASSMIRLERTPLTSTVRISGGWTRYPRLAVRAVQKLFITALVLPLVVVGLIVLGRSHQWRALVVLLAVPCYYFCVQSALHTEYRYVLAVDCFLFVLAAVAINEIVRSASNWLPARRHRQSSRNERTAQPIIKTQS